MLIYYYAALPRYGGVSVEPWQVGILGALFYASELVGSPIFGILSDRAGASPDHAGGTRLRRHRRGHHGAHRQPAGDRLHATPRGRLDGGLDSIDPGVHRLRDRLGRVAARQGGRQVRGGDPRRAPGGLRDRRPAVRGTRAAGLPGQRRAVRRVVRDLPVGGPGARGARAVRSQPRPSRGAPPVPPNPPRVARLAARTDLGRDQRDAGAVHEPDAVPAGPRARSAVRGPGADERVRTAAGERRPGRRRPAVLRRPALLGQPVPGHAADVDRHLRHRGRGGHGRRGHGHQPRRHRVHPLAARPDRGRGRRPVRARRVPRPPRSACWRT